MGRDIAAACVGSRGRDEQYFGGADLDRVVGDLLVEAGHDAEDPEFTEVCKECKRSLSVRETAFARNSGVMMFNRRLSKQLLHFTSFGL